MKIRIPIIRKNWTEWDIALLCYPLCIFCMSIERYINYIILVTILFLVLSLWRNKKIYINILSILWIFYLLIYPLGDYVIRCQSGVTNYVLLGYTVSFILLIVQNTELKQHKVIETYMLLLAMFEAVGYILNKVAFGLYTKLAYNLVSRYNEIGSFTVNDTVAAFIIAIGVAIVLAWILECGEQEIWKKRKLSIIMLLLIIGLIYSGKRTIFVTTLVCCGLIYTINCARSLKAIIRYMIIGVIVLAVLIGVSILFYNWYGDTNTIGRLGATFIGITNNEDITNYRSILARYMVEWWRESLETTIYGIGWGNFYNRVVTYVNVPNGHCVYLQLLCEEGIIGFTIFVIIALATMWISVKNILYFCNKKGIPESRIANIVLFGLTLFFVYCYTGNALYDMYCYLYFFLFIGWAVLLSRKRKNGIGRLIRFQ